MYDVIVIGARCAGAPTALLLARKGYRVLLVDKATFPSDCLNNKKESRDKRAFARGLFYLTSAPLCAGRQDNALVLPGL